MRFIEDFNEDDKIVGHYFCKQKQSQKSKAGKTYFNLKLQDKTGYINAKVWDLNNDIQNFEEGNYIKIDGIALMYQNEMQLKVTKIRKSQEGEYNPTDYVPCTDKDIVSLTKALNDIINSINNQYIKQLLDNIFNKNQVIQKSFASHSAAKAMHHGYFGGLIEHTISVAQTCDFLSDRYKYVNRDILVASALLHDVGKIFELSPFPDNDYTDDGELLGHLIIGTELIGETAREIEGFPHELASLLKHSILSHHGELMYGSPKEPKTIEAFILHCADNMDAKVKMYEEAIKDSNTSGNWVGYNRMLSRNIRTSHFDK